MDKRQIVSKLSPSMIIGKGKLEFKVLVEYSALIKFLYILRGDTKKLALVSLGEYLGSRVKLRCEGDGIWSITLVEKICVETYTLIK